MLAYSSLVLLENADDMGVLSKQHSVLAVKSSHTSWAVFMEAVMGVTIYLVLRFMYFAQLSKAALLLKKDLGNEYVLKEQFTRDELNATLGFQTGRIILKQYFI